VLMVGYSQGTMHLRDALQLWCIFDAKVNRTRPSNGLNMALGVPNAMPPKIVDSADKTIWRVLSRHGNVNGGDPSAKICCDARSLIAGWSNLGAFISRRAADSVMR